MLYKPNFAEKISTLVRTANLNIESYWPSLFAKLCHNRNIDDLVMNAGPGGSSAATMAVSFSSPAAGGATQAAPAAEQKKKEEVKEESEDDLVFVLFD
ncbi:unnamed protein product [Thlaspi arvense]|uniref:60S acidic ribosomal protein P1 n=1 Tax=Thlaspi arvense TaxID=13288 RepID=A0AAU9R866_THLAR|nr:unnamed protein product [Thlaspi arvense]